MNKFIENVVIWKNYACMMFTGCVCVYGVIALATGSEELNVWIVLQMLLISAVGTLIQYIAFAPEFAFKKMKYANRILLFAISYLVMLTVFALIFNWFPTGEIMSWVVFLGIFLLILVIMTLSFELVFKMTGKHYNGLLGQYHEKQQKEQEEKNN